MKRKPKYQIGQVVTIRRLAIDSHSEPARPHKIKSFDGVFYTLWDSEDLSWRESELRPLTKRERGDRKSD